MLSEIETRLTQALEARDRELEALREEIRQLGTRLDLALKKLDELSSRLESLAKEFS